MLPSNIRALRKCFDTQSSAQIMPVVSGPA